MKRLEKHLFQLLIFLIPTNLFIKWILPESHVNGILVDYLIPKLYLSDFIIITLLILWFISHKKKFPPDKKITANIKVVASVIVLTIVLLLVGLLSKKPVAASWYWLKLIEWITFAYWLKTHQKIASPHQITVPLSLAIIFQSIVGFAQLGFQSSVAGYWFLGETTLRHAANIAKIDLAFLPLSLENTLIISPYGTTPHPNVLGGFLSIGLLILFALFRQKPNRPLHHKILFACTGLVGTIALCATGSFSAWIALGVGFFTIGLTVTTSRHRRSLIKKRLLYLVSACALLIVILWSKNSIKLPLDSVERRLELNSFALQMWQDHPLFGVGLNQFSARLPEYGVVNAYTSFLQPVHNIYLLWLAETGLIGTGLLILIYANQKKNPLHPSNTSISIPLIMVLTIGLFDHYPLTLQTGQLLLVIAGYMHDLPTTSTTVKVRPHPTKSSV